MVVQEGNENFDIPESPSFEGGTGIGEVAVRGKIWKLDVAIKHTEICRSKGRDCRNVKD